MPDTRTLGLWRKEPAKQEPPGCGNEAKDIMQAGDVELRFRGRAALPAFGLLFCFAGRR